MYAQSTGSVHGTVVYGDTGKPASKANIWLEPANRQHAGPQIDPITGEYELRDSDIQQQRFPATIAEDGVFNATSIPAGDYVVHVYAPPYLSPDDSVYPISKTTHVATGSQVSPKAVHVQIAAGETANVSIRLQRGGIIEGTLRRTDGAPVASDPTPPFGAAMNAMRKTGDREYARSGGSAHPDARGHYRLEGLGPGDYVVFAGLPGPVVSTATGMIGSSGLAIYAPGTASPSQAAIIHISGTETKYADVTLPSPASLHRVEGTVILDDRNALRGVVIRLYPKDEGALTAGTSMRADGGFSFENVPDGEYTIAIDFPPKVEVVSADPANGKVRMRMKPALYAPLQQNVTLAGQNVTGILLHPLLVSSKSDHP